MIGVSIVGGTGYGAGELLRLLHVHPEVEVVEVVSKSSAGDDFSSSHPHLAEVYCDKFVDHLDLEKLSSFDKQFVFAALPHGASAEFVLKMANFLENGGVVIDLSGDFRLKDEAQHCANYGDSPFLPEVRDQSVYGLPEFFRKEIKSAKLIANPGCYATCCALAAGPISKANVGIEHIVFDAKSGSSGGGRGLKDLFHHPRRNGSMTTYSVLSHRHEPEIAQTLSASGGQQTSISFVPHLLPISRGIFVTAHIILEKEATYDELCSLYEKAYASEPFVRLRKSSPEIADVVGSNYCDIALHVRGNVVVVTAVLDNLVKGMAGQAIQNLNIISGLDEKAGLGSLGLGIV